MLHLTYHPQDVGSQLEREAFDDYFAGGTVRSLSLGLRHRWCPEDFFVIITAYIDESGTHDSNFSLLAGHVSDSRQWREYEKRTAKLFKMYGVQEFHAIDVRRGRKSFKDWTVDKKVEFLDDFQDIINQTIERNLFSIISKEDYIWYRNLVRPNNRIIVESKYAILFRALMSMLLWEVPRVDRWRGQHEPSLFVVVEQGHPNAGDVIRFYNEACASFPESKALKGLTFQPKAGNLALAASDLLAYSTYKSYSGAKNIGVLNRKSKAEASYKGTTYGRLVDRQDLLTLSKWRQPKR